MAWKTQPTQSKDDSTYPGLLPTSPDGTVKSHYLETQTEEVFALQAIYGDDFIEHKAANTAWKKAEPSFDLRIKASSNEDLGLTLSVVLTATYPKSAPLLSIKDDDSLSKSTQFKVQNFIKAKPRSLIQAGSGEPMIHELVEGLQDILEDAALAKINGTEKSLEEERAAHEAELARQAQELQEEEERKRQDATKEEERVMQDMIQKEVDRQRLKVKETKKRNRQVAANHGTEDLHGSESDNIEFDQPVEITGANGAVFLFGSVTGKTEFRAGQIATTYRVWPSVQGGYACPSLAVKEFELRAGSKEAAQFKTQVQTLEADLESVKKISHRNVMPLLNYRIDRVSDDTDPSSLGWTVRLLTPLAERGSLQELLEVAGQLDVGKVRSWTADLLNALGHLHNHGLVHQDIHTDNVLIFREVMGDTVPKLSDVAYERQLQNLCRKSRAVSSSSSARSAYWLPPEIAGNSKPHFTQKTDVWDLGVVFLQMIFGVDVFQRYQSPSSLMDTLSLSGPLHELVSRFFKSDPKKRPRAFELGSSEFLATDAPVLISETPLMLSPSHSATNLHHLPARPRRESTSLGHTHSRYKEDFVEEGRLGKGGFGEVVKARKKLDGQIYAIKKISQRSSASLSEVLKEVRLLSQISHPAVVRYYNTWLEEIPDFPEHGDETSTEDTGTDMSRQTDSPGLNIEFATDTGGLDFISSTGYPAIEFGVHDSESEDESSDEDEDESDSEDDSTVEDSALAAMPSPRRVRSHQRAFRTVMYISMEYCDKRTLRDLIQRNLYKETDEIWRLFRQVLEGLVYIHGLSIVHRDLKPDNIFIGLGPDGLNNVKIGDFGLATTGQFAVDKHSSAMDSSDMTRSIGTSYYVAPEVRRGGGSYTSKVDMYSLGIMFFEMNYHSMLGMERADKLGKLGTASQLPDDFQPVDHTMTEIIQSLVTHDVKSRPSSADLLRSGKLPVQLENETTRRALASLTDSASPYYPKVVSTLFSQPVEPTKDYTWDMSAQTQSVTELLHQGIVKEELVAIFRKHGAVEINRSSLYPRSSHYSVNQNLVKLLDESGCVVQLPFDLMLGNARALAKQDATTIAKRSFTFGRVYRHKQSGGQPLMIGEVDFDVVSADNLDLALKEAEVIKVLDEIIETFPSSSPMCFHLGHSDLLQLIFDFCNVDLSARHLTAESLSKLNIHSFTFQKIRAELRSPLIGISATTIEDLKRFDFRDTPTKAFSKLRAIFEGSPMYEKAQSTIAHLKDVIEYTKRLGIHAKIYINPLSSVKENFFSGGILFQCIYDKKFRDVFAAGGRYDSLIRAHRPKIGTQAKGLHAVGFSLAWEKLARLPKSGGKAFLKKSEEEPQGIFNSKRCDVLVASFDAHILRTAGLELLTLLWSHDVSAELARDARSPDELVSRNRDESYSWIIMLKQDSVLKIRTMDRKDVADVEIPASQLLNWLRSAVRERATRHAGASLRAAENTLALGLTHTAGAGGSGGGTVIPNTEQEVRVLVAGTRSKKFNRRIVIEQAQANAASLLQDFLDGPIAAVETSDVVLDLIQNTALSDVESWRRAEQSVDKNERKYVQEIHDMLSSWRAAWDADSGERHAFVYNFRTTKCIYYDLGA
ncbi:translation initiation factor kinase [Microdochium bolleyi]|uniref:non-specific serine/threonine protein kinase n=1 Tax=Microdochium bolleyi TaxID=196109 RepID=A0A136J752_9PEZI|nr:translation initiation factor kinase [Microdochium bolleyi]